MRKLLVACAAAGLLALPAATALGQNPSHGWSANIGLFSDYLFRGISQTSGGPAIQGGFDYSYDAGPVNLYAGTWASNISWLEDSGSYTQSNLEVDFYGGVDGTFGHSDFGYDAGIHYYYYPGSRNPGAVSANTTEVYTALSWKWLTVKYSYALSDYFGTRDASGASSAGTTYVEFSASYPLSTTGFEVSAHYGILDIDGNHPPDTDPGYNDWNIGAAYTVQSTVFKDTRLGAFFSGTININRIVYTTEGRDSAENRFVFYVTKTF